MDRKFAAIPTEADREGIDMPLNPNLIKTQLDDEEYKHAAPTLGTLMLARFSAPDSERHNPVVYGADGLFFATHPTRRMYLREAFPNEFDIWTTMEDFEQRPKLWVLVTLLCEGFHEITPRWRGKPFWRSGETDEAVTETVIQASMRGGLSVAEWYGFISDQRTRKSAAAKHRSKRDRNVN